MSIVVNRIAILISTLIAGCSMAPGLYIDKLDVPKRKESSAELLGGKIKIIPITAALAARHKMEYENRLQEKRIRAHQLFLDNQSAQEGFEYRVGNYDILNITVWGHPELNVLATSSRPGLAPQPVVAYGLGPGGDTDRVAVSTGHLVDNNGNLFFPQIGMVHVAGRTLPEIRSIFTKRLAKFIPNPQLDVGVAAYRSQHVYVLGEVKNPKAISITDVPLELIEAVTLAGGFTKDANTRNVFLTRDKQTYYIDIEAIYEKGDLTQNYILKQGDVLQVPENRLNRVYALGEFNKNGSVLLPPRFFSMAEMIEHRDVEGLNLESVDASQIFIFRYKELKYDSDTKTYQATPEVYHLDASSAEAMLLAANFPLQARDVLYAAPTGLTRWSRVVDQVLPTLQALWYPARTIRDWENLNE
jgi:polysaccharide export outer membrane protein